MYIGVFVGIAAIKGVLANISQYSGAEVGDNYKGLAYIEICLIFLVVWKAFSGLLVVRRTLGVVSADLIDEIGIDLVVRWTRVHDGSGCHS